MNASKIVLPPSVATAIAHYVALADSKHEAFTDILSLGYEAERSEIILRHFDGDYDELMEALICGYEVEKSPEDDLIEYYKDSVKLYNESQLVEDKRFYLGKVMGVRTSLRTLGIKIDGINGVND